MTLNPPFVEALMGWPTGWTGFDSVGTEWCRWWRPRRNFRELVREMVEADIKALGAGKEPTNDVLL